MSIRAVAFDMGGTLEDIRYDDESRREAARGLHELLVERDLDPGLSAPELLVSVLTGMKAYQAWRERTERELPPERIWSRYVFAGAAGKRPRGWLRRLAAVAEEIALFYEDHFFTRSLRPEAPAALAALRERGLRLAVISNITSRGIVPQKLAAYGVARSFETVITSVDFGRRKPHPGIFREVARRMALPPAACAYVGDTVSRDVIGARRAGYGRAIQIVSFLTGTADRGTEGVQPDAIIRNLGEVVGLVSPVEAHLAAAGSPHAAVESNARKAKAMQPTIEAIFIDVGNTLRLLVADEPHQAGARSEIAALVGVQESPEAFCAMLDQRYKGYRKWAFETLREASEQELWTRWLLPDQPRDRIAPLSGELTFLYRKTMGRRFAAPDAKRVAIELSRRGYRLGILSNTITEREIPLWLKEDGLEPYFSTVVLSSIFGRRKPGREIFLEAARSAGVEPARSAYIADNPSRDVPGCRQAGFGEIVILMDPAEQAKTVLKPDETPDRFIHSLAELLDLYPDREPAAVRPSSARAR